MNKCAKLKQNIGFTAIGMGIPCETPKSSQFYFSLVPPHVSHQFHLVDLKAGFLPLKWRRLILLPVLPSLSPLFFPNQVSRSKAGLQHLCPRQHKASRHQSSTHRQWWKSQPHAKSRTILQIACIAVLLQLRFCFGNIEIRLFSSFLVESS